MAWQCISPDVNVKGFKKCCTYTAVDETDDMLWNGSEEEGTIRSECQEDEGTDCEDGDATLTGKGRQNVTCFTYQVYKINTKIFV